jgi:hypothetical protein
MRTFQTYQVIERPKMGYFAGLPSAEPGTVLVIDRENHELRTLGKHSDGLTPGEARFGRIRTLYRVDVREHMLDFEDEFRSSGDVGGFRAHVSFACQVADPAAVVKRGIQDATELLLPLISQTLRRTLGTIDAEHFDSAEEIAINAVKEIERENRHDRAFQIGHFSVTLSLDEASASYVRERKEAAREIIRERDRAKIARQKAELESELASQRDQIEAIRASNAARFETERLSLQRLRDEVEGELAKRRLEMELDRDDVRAKAVSRTDNELQMQNLEARFTIQEKEAALDRAKANYDLARTALEQDREWLMTNAQVARDELLEKAKNRLQNEIQIESLGYRRSIEQSEAELARARRIFDHSEAEVELKHKLTMTSGEIEREKLLANHYLGLLESGNYGGLATLLMKEPGSIANVVDMLIEQNNIEANRRMNAFVLLMNSDAVEEWRINEEAKRVLTELANSWTRTNPVKHSDGPPAVASGTTLVDSESAVTNPSEAHNGDAGDVGSINNGDAQTVDAEDPQDDLAYEESYAGDRSER